MVCAVQLSSVQQSEALLQQDKSYLGGQVNELTHKLALLEEKLLEMNTELSSSKQSKEDLYKILIKSRSVTHSCLVLDVIMPSYPVLSSVMWYQGWCHMISFLVSCDVIPSLT